MITNIHKLETELSNDIDKYLLYVSSELYAYSYLMGLPVILSYLLFIFLFVYTLSRPIPDIGFFILIIPILISHITFFYYLYIVARGGYRLIRKTVSFDMYGGSNRYSAQDKQFNEVYGVQKENAILLTIWFGSMIISFLWSSVWFVFGPSDAVDATGNVLESLSLNVGSILEAINSIVSIDLTQIFDFLGLQGVLFLIWVTPIVYSTYLFFVSSRILLLKIGEEKYSKHIDRHSMREELTGFIGISTVVVVELIRERKNNHIKHLLLRTLYAIVVSIGFLLLSSSFLYILLL